MFLAKHYLGVHLTAQLSKVIERLLKPMFEPYLEKHVAFGDNQFAYRSGRGCRDALALLVMSWITSFSNREKIAVYCSDVAGAFDRVSTARLLDKLRNTGMHFRLVNIIGSWLEQRRANVIVGGTQSKDLTLENMVYRGTVLGPILWILFFADASLAIRLSKYIEIVFADDLQAHRAFKISVTNTDVLRTARNCQNRLQQWGKANQVEFDPAKESITILSRQTSYGESFKTLGVIFDIG